MRDVSGKSKKDGAGAAGPRAILRVPDVLMALAESADGRSFTELCAPLDLPKTSLHRMLKTLTAGHYIVQEGGLYRLGPRSAQLAKAITLALSPPGFPQVVRPFLESLAKRTGESVILGVLDEARSHVFYVDVINSNAPLRVMVPQGNTRPLYSAASGQIMLAYLPREEREEYLAKANFEAFTEETARRGDVPAILDRARRDGIIFDRNGSFSGASGLAVPCFNARGEISCAVSIAGPTERIERSREGIVRLLVIAGRSISRLLGYEGRYPAMPPN